MERYPEEFGCYLAPLVVIQGLGTDSQLHKLSDKSQKKLDRIQSKDAKTSLLPVSDKGNPFYNDIHGNGETVSRSFPVVQAPNGLELAAELLQYNVSHDSVYPDLTIPVGHKSTTNYVYNINFVDTEYIIPMATPKLGVFPREKSSEALSEDTETNGDTVAEKYVSSHPLSPFNPNTQFKEEICSLYWIQKYIHVKPFAFVSVHELDVNVSSEEEIREVDLKLAQEIKQTKEQITAKEMKFLCILLCSKSSDTAQNLDARVDFLRKQTGLPSRYGLLFLPACAQRELDAFVMSILNLIKTWSTEFYTSIQKSIKTRTQRKTESIEFPTSYWAARQAFKLAVIEEIKGISDVSVKSFEFAYESLIEVVRLSASTSFSSKSWLNIRLLLDFVGFHITRSYLLLGDANMAYKKFDIHIQNVISILQIKKISAKTYPVLSWLSLQFAWLGELCHLAPESVVPIDRPWQPYTLKNSRWHQAAEIPHNNVFSMPQSAYLFLQAVSLIRKRKLVASQSNKDDRHDMYMALELDEELSFDYGDQCTKLLSKALSGFGRSKDTKFNRSEMFVYFQIAEEYYKKENFAMAVNNYIISLSILKNEHWNTLVSIVLYRLYECSCKLQNYEYALQYYLQLCSIDSNTLNLPFNNIGQTFVDDVKNINLKSEPYFNLFSNSIIFQKSSVNLSDTARLQLHIELKANKYLHFFKVNDINIMIDGLENAINIKNDDSLTCETFCTLGQLNEQSTFYSNLDFSTNTKKVLEIDLQLPNFGKYSIESVHLSCSVGSVTFDYGLPLTRSHSLDKYRWYKKTPVDNMDLLYDVVALKDPLSVDVIPDDPKTKVTTSCSKICYASELFCLDLNIENEDQKRYGLKVEAVATVDSVEADATWDENKDNDKSISNFLNAGVLEVGTTNSHKIRVKIPPKLKKDGELQVMFNISYFVDNKPKVKVVKKQMVVIPVKIAFSTMTVISPRIKKNVPSATETALKTEEHLLPQRFWYANTKLTYFKDILAEDDMDILGYKFKVKSNAGPDSVEIVESHESDDFRQFSLVKGGSKELGCYFLTHNRESRRGIAIEMLLDIQFKRRSESTVNTYTEAVWSGNVSLMDPRALVNVIYPDGDESLTRFLLEYRVENPTSNIFQFSSTLFESDNFKISGIRNNAFSVQPTSTYILKYEMDMEAKALESDQGKVKLPECKIYDVNYKVHLSPLAASSAITVAPGGLYVRSK